MMKMFSIKRKLLKSDLLERIRCRLKHLKMIKSLVTNSNSKAWILEITDSQ